MHTSGDIAGNEALSLFPHTLCLSRVLYSDGDGGPTQSGSVSGVLLPSADSPPVTFTLLLYIAILQFNVTGFRGPLWAHPSNGFFF